MQRRLLLGALAVLGASTGALAGLDAARMIDGFYLTPREPRYHALPAAVRPASAWDTGPVYAASPAAGSIWGQEIGPAERAFFDTGVPDHGVSDIAADSWDEPPVRVHRASRPVAAAEPAGPAERPQPEADDPVDGWVDPPPPAEDRLPQPSLD